MTERITLTEGKLAEKAAAVNTLKQNLASATEVKEKMVKVMAEERSTLRQDMARLQEVVAKKDEEMKQVRLHFTEVPLFQGEANFNVSISDQEIFLTVGKTALTKTHTQLPPSLHTQTYM
jgi:flagellar biosynthesis/type III secretory pathway chaperone